MIPILIEKILSLALMMAMGFALVKCKVVSSRASNGLSAISLYLIMPCVILSSFQVEYSEQVRDGLLLAFVAAVAIHGLLILLNLPLKRLLKLDAVEQTSIIYSNAGNLVIPMVTAVLGQEWVIYSSAFLAVQLILLWSHGKAVLCGERGFHVKKIITNFNMIAIVIGIVLFVTQIKLPSFLGDAVDSMAGIVGPVAMLVVGMTMASMNFKELLSYKRMWMVAALRLVLVPLLVIVLLKYTGIQRLTADGEKVLLVTLLATATPQASTICQFAQVFGKDEKYASAINVVTTLLCIVTIPLMVTLYQLS